MSEKLYLEIGQEFEQQQGTEMGQMFGKACLKKSKKVFAAFFKGEMVFKLGQEEVNMMFKKYPGSCKWDPSGKNRSMKDWLQVPADFSEDWRSLTEKALQFVS